MRERRVKVRGESEGEREESEGEREEKVRERRVKVLSLIHI